MLRYELPNVPTNWDQELTEQKGLQVKTYSYFEYDEVKSALQKSIRRGNEMEAIQWCLEGFLTNDICRTNVWNRLIVISMEDVGLADINAVTVVYKLSQDKDNIQSIITAVLYLARSLKTRVNDWAIHMYCEFNNQEYNKNLEPPETLKVYLIQNLKKKDLFKSLWYIKALCHTPEKVTGKYKNAQIYILETFDELYPKNKYIATLYELAMSKNFRWNEKSRLIHTQICHMVIYDLIPKDIVSTIEPDQKLQQLADDHKLRKNLLGMPDYAVDKHTLRGRQMGKNIKDFMESGGVLINEDQKWKELSKMYLSMCELH